MKYRGGKIRIRNFNVSKRSSDLRKNTERYSSVIRFSYLLIRE